MIYNDQTAAVIDPWLAKGFHDLDFDTYCSLDAANSHGLMDLRRSPRFYQWKKKNRTVSDAKEFGTLVHMLVLEPGLLERRVKLKKKVDGRTKEGKSYNADFEASLTPDDIPVDEPTYETVSRLRDDLLKHPWTSRIMGKGVNEQTATWVHNETQVFCKMRLDKLLVDQGWIVDIKTTRDASPRAFQRDLVNFNYDLQAAFYMRGFEYIYKRRPEGYIFLCIENTQPHDIAIYTPEATVIEHGTYKFRTALQTYRDCCINNSWPGYPTKAQPLELPGWAVYQEEQ